MPNNYAVLALSSSHCRVIWLMHICRLTAALFEDDGAAEFVEPLSIETRPVNRHCVLWDNKIKHFIFAKTITLKTL